MSEPETPEELPVSELMRSYSLSLGSRDDSLVSAVKELKKVKKGHILKILISWYLEDFAKSEQWGELYAPFIQDETIQNLVSRLCEIKAATLEERHDLARLATAEYEKRKHFIKERDVKTKIGMHLPLTLRDLLIIMFTRRKRQDLSYPQGFAHISEKTRASVRPPKYKHMSDPFTYILEEYIKESGIEFDPERERFIVTT